MVFPAPPQFEKLKLHDVIVLPILYVILTLGSFTLGNLVLEKPIYEFKTKVDALISREFYDDDHNGSLDRMVQYTIVPHGSSKVERNLR